MTKLTHNQSLPTLTNIHKPTQSRIKIHFFLGAKNLWLVISKPVMHNLQLVHQPVLFGGKIQRGLLSGNLVSSIWRLTPCNWCCCTTWSCSDSGILLSSFLTCVIFSPLHSSLLWPLLSFSAASLLSAHQPGSPLTFCTS